MKDCSLFDFESEKLPKSIVLLALSNTRITKHIGRIHSLHGGHVSPVRCLYPRCIPPVTYTSPMAHFSSLQISPAHSLY